MQEKNKSWPTAKNTIRLGKLRLKRHRGPPLEKGGMTKLTQEVRDANKTGMENWRLS